MAHLSDFDTEKRYKAVVKDTSRLTPKDTEEIREIVLEVKDAAFECEVDQSFGVLVKATGDFGNTYHHRLYSVADLPSRINGNSKITMLVKRCSYIDDFNGEEYKGVASNYLCDRKKGDEITVTGPFQLPFRVPEDKSSNMILIGMGTGIAPFRAFIKHIYKNVKDWEGQIRLFYGARSGLELLYLNDKDGDLKNYYDKDTFEAFHALSPRPQWADSIELEKVLEEQTNELKKLLSKSNTYVYVAGYANILNKLNKSFSKILGSEEKWKLRKAELIAGRKWAEIIF